MALGKSLVAQLQANDENGVSLILWDTSGDDRDVNINAVLRDKLCGHTPGDGITFDDMPPLESFVSGGKPSSESSVQPEVAVNEAVGGATATAAAAAPAAVAAAPVAPMDLEQLFAMDLSTFKPLVQTHPPNIDDFFDISVTLAASPSNFTVRFQIMAFVTRYCICILTGLVHYFRCNLMLMRRTWMTYSGT